MRRDEIVGRARCLWVET